VDGQVAALIRIFRRHADIREGFAGARYPRQLGVRC
jgi:hypothetical protein